MEPQPRCIGMTRLPTRPPSRGSVDLFTQQAVDVQSPVWVDRPKRLPHSSLKSRGVTQGHLNSAPQIKQDDPAIPEAGTNVPLYLQEFNHFLHHSCSQRLLHSLQRGREGAAQHPGGSLGEQKQGNSDFSSDMARPFNITKGEAKQPLILEANMHPDVTAKCRQRALPLSVWPWPWGRQPRGRTRCPGHTEALTPLTGRPVHLWAKCAGTQPY